MWVRFKVLIVTRMKMPHLWDIALRSLIKSDQRFGCLLPTASLRASHPNFQEGGHFLCHLSFRYTLSIVACLFHYVGDFCPLIIWLREWSLNERVASDLCSLVCYASSLLACFLFKVYNSNMSRLMLLCRLIIEHFSAYFFQRWLNRGK
jgi:hypothetical protein